LVVMGAVDDLAGYHVLSVPPSLTECHPGT
jgi:hypothetical protein